MVCPSQVSELFATEGPNDPTWCLASGLLAPVADQFHSSEIILCAPSVDKWVCLKIG